MYKDHARIHRSISNAAHLVEALEIRRLLSAGDLDTTFSLDGKVEVPVTTDTTNFPDQLEDIIVRDLGPSDPNPRRPFAVGVVHTSSPKLGTVQFTDSGALDSSYGSGGIATNSATGGDFVLSVGGVVQDGTVLRTNVTNSHSGSSTARR